MMKIAAANWREHGNILGTNEIMGLMFHRDVMVLGLSDGVMCAVTGFGLLLQNIIFRGFLSWDKQGWIIQSVSFMDYPNSSEINRGLFRFGKPYISLSYCIGPYSESGRGPIQFSSYSTAL